MSKMNSIDQDKSIEIDVDVNRLRKMEDVDLLEEIDQWRKSPISLYGTKAMTLSRRHAVLLLNEVEVRWRKLLNVQQESR